jgi:ring-1,2-phenylacetyl-CoA epoxidase subunit PaaD
VTPAAVSVKAPIDLEAVRRRVEAVPDPELPVLSLGQLGVIREVRVADAEAGTVIVDITPTYSGCPAMEVISRDVADAIRAAGYQPDVRLVLSPPWSTDWISADGRAALAAAGIAPPHRVADGPVAVRIGRFRFGPTPAPPAPAPETPACPQCGSVDVEELARFGSTACKALWRCLACREPFDYVKPR